MSAAGPSPRTSLSLALSFPGSGSQPTACRRGGPESKLRVRTPPAPGIPTVLPFSKTQSPTITLPLPFAFSIREKCCSPVFLSLPPGAGAGTGLSTPEVGGRSSGAPGALGGHRVGMRRPLPEVASHCLARRAWGQASVHPRPFHARPLAASSLTCPSQLPH